MAKNLDDLDRLRPVDAEVLRNAVAAQRKRQRAGRRSPDELGGAAPVAGRPSAVLRERRNEVVTLIERLGGRNPRVFGSVARGTDGPGSDIDLLIDAEPGRTWDVVTLPRVLSELLGIPVNVVTASGLRPTDRTILAEALPL